MRVPLYLAENNQDVLITRIAGNDMVKSRLEAMGFVAGKSRESQLHSTMSLQKEFMCKGELKMTLRDLKVGQSGRILKNHTTGALKRRFMDMGITKDVWLR